MPKQFTPPPYTPKAGGQSQRHGRASARSPLTGGRVGWCCHHHATGSPRQRARRDAAGSARKARASGARHGSASAAQGQFARPASAAQGQFARPASAAQGQFARPASAAQGQFARPASAAQGQFARPAQAASTTPQASPQHPYTHPRMIYVAILAKGSANAQNTIIWTPPPSR